MQVFIRGHETTVQSRWRDHIYDRLAKLERFEDRIIRVEYFLTTSHHHLKGSVSTSTGRNPHPPDLLLIRMANGSLPSGFTICFAVTK